MPRGFASDNSSGIHPEVLEAIGRANVGHASAYGNDAYSASLTAKFQELFGPSTEVFFVFNGTAANVLCLKALTEPHHAIICAETAHAHVDECGAPERFTGCKVLPVSSPDGKVRIEKIAPLLKRRGDVHAAQPAVLCISQPTEYGTVYDLDELGALTEFARSHNLRVHIDGARLANAAASLEVPLRDLVQGASAVSFGGTKNGLMCGEAILLFERPLAERFAYVRKQGLHLASKMRFLAAQFDALLTNQLWLRNAQHANSMARLLADRVKELPQVRITQPVQVNGVFALLPREVIPTLQQKFPFYVWNDETAEVRWMTSFDTTSDDVETFVQCLRDLLT